MSNGLFLGIEDEEASDESLAEYAAESAPTIRHRISEWEYLAKLELGITEAYARLGFRALGFFVIDVGGRGYGVRSPNATMLACSFDQVKKHIVDLAVTQRLSRPR
jgi:hypothetical protein